MSDVVGYGRGFSVVLPSLSAVRVSCSEVFVVGLTTGRQVWPGAVARVLSAHKKAARVFPDPVGATTNAFSPAEMADQAAICTGVGWANTSRNQVAMWGENLSKMWSSGSGMGLVGMLPFNQTTKLY